MADDMACHISKIPLETLLRITDHLSTTDLGSFRMTCRSVADSLDNTFVNEFFSRKQFMISKFSLQALIDMAKSRIGQHMRVIQIGTDHFAYSSSLNRVILDPEKAKCWDELLTEYLNMWIGKTYRSMLAEALKSLPNLEDIIIRDCNSRGRSRDGPGTEWRSYGVATIFNDTGVKTTMHGFDDLGQPEFKKGISGHIFAGAIYAIAVSGSPAKGIEIIARMGLPLDYEAFGPPLLDYGPMAPALQQLEKLHLSIRHIGAGLRRDDLSDDDSLSDDPDQAEAELRERQALLNFLSRTTNLKNLRINGHRASLSNHPSEYILKDLMRASETRASVKDGEVPRKPLQMPPVEELSLGMLNTDGQTMLDFIVKLSPSLRSLELWKIKLFRSLPEGETGIPEVSFWPSFFRKLIAIPGLNLHHIKLGMLQQEWRITNKTCFVSFKEGGQTVAYTGPDWRTFVEKSVLPQIQVQWPPKRVPQPVSSHEDETGSESEDLQNNIID